MAAGLLGLHLASPGAAAILTIFISGLAIGAAAIVWISLLVRKALLLVAIVFAPIALAGASWDHTRGWVSKWASFVIALIVSKVVLVVIFLLATAQVSAPIDADLQSVSEPIAGVVLMLMAGFAPYLTYKAINFIGFDMYHAMSAEQEAKSALNRPMPIPINRTPSTQPNKILAGGPTTGAPGAGPPTPPPPPATGPGPATSGGGAAAGGAMAGGAAAGAATAGAIAVKEAATAGPKSGTAVAGAATAHADAAHQAPTAPPGDSPPQVADAVPALSSSRKG